MTPPPALLLFDIDGTMLSTDGAGMQAMRHTAEAMFGPTFSFDGVDPGGGLDPWIFAEAARRSGVLDAEDQVPCFRDRYLAELERQLAVRRGHIRIMPGILELIDHLHAGVAAGANHVLGMLTGNFTGAVPLKMAAIGVDLQRFSVTAFGDEAPTRPDLVALAMRRYTQRTGIAPRPGRVIIIGDTPRDVHCAHAHGCVAFAVATGKYTREDLVAAGADHVVEDLADPDLLLSLLALNDARREIH